jgi:hypothetical protein
VLEERSSPAPASVLLATDLQAGSVLRAERGPELVIDPKPFVGDPAYDATQHLLNCPERLQQDPADTIRPFSDLLGVEAERGRLWVFARCAAEPTSRVGRRADRAGAGLVATVGTGRYFAVEPASSSVGLTAYPKRTRRSRSPRRSR